MGIVAVGGDHHVLAAVALEVAEAGVLSHLRSLADTAFQRLHEHRAVLLGPLVVLFVHLVRVALPAVEDALQLALVVERVDEVAIDDPRTEVPRATELVHEVRLVSIEEIDALCEQADELGFHLPEGEVPATVQIRHGVNLGIPKRLPVVVGVSGDDVPVEPAVVSFGLPARVVHAGADRVELDRPPHHFPGDATEAAEEVEDHTAVVFLRVVGTCALLVVVVVEVALVDVLFHEVRVGLAGMAGGAVVLVVPVAGVMPVGHDAFSDSKRHITQSNMEIA